ncbi:MAG: tetratricopeptide repeat protein [Roseburia sp.]
MKKKWICLTVMSALLVALTGCGTDKAQEKKEAYRQIGFNCMEQGDYQGAVEAFQSALDQSVGIVGEEEIDTCYYKAACYYMNGDIENAIACYEALITYDETNADAYYLLGNLYLAQGNAEQAKISYDHAISQDENNYELYIAIYEQVTGAGYQQEGEEYLRKALDLTGKTGEDYLQRGRIYLILGDYDNAQEQLDEASDKKHPDAPLYLAELYEVRGESEKAEALYASYAETHENDPEALMKLVDMKLETENYQDAVEYLNKLLSSEEKLEQDQQLRLDLIYCYEQMMDFPSARTALEEYLALYPEDTSAQREYTFLQTR